MKQYDDAYTQIKEAYDGLIPSEQRIADFILTHQGGAATLSIGEVSEMCNVSKTTVTRFSRSLGFEGFKDFKYSLILSTADTVPRDLVGQINKEDSVSEVFNKVSAANCAAIERTGKLIDEKSVEKLAKKIESSNKILLLANGGSTAIALDFYHKFLRIGVQCEFTMDSRMQEMSASILNKNDLAIAFTFFGTNKAVVESLKIAKDKNASTACFTNTLGSPITENSNITICASNFQRSPLTESIEPRIAMLNMVDVLFVYYVVKNSESISSSVMDTLEILERARLYDYN